MVSNKFATMLHRHTNKISVILVYTLLEWILIALLLLNALFSYLIAKFAAFFGLKPPCLFCSRVDHLFEPGKGRSSYRNILCDEHATEVSKLGFCSNHRKLAESSDMCEDCLSSRPSSSGLDRTVALFSWMRKSEEGEKDLRCSCCDEILENGFYSPYLVLKSSWGVLDYTQKGNSVLEPGEDYDGHIKDEILDGGEEGKDEEQVEGEGGTDDIMSEQELEGTNLLHCCDVCCLEEDMSSEILTLRLENVSDKERLIPVELIDDTTLMKYLNSSRFGGEVDGEVGQVTLEQAVIASDIGNALQEQSGLLPIVEIVDNTSFQLVEPVDFIEERSPVPVAEESNVGGLLDHQCTLPQATCTTPQEGDEIEVETMAAVENFDEPQALEEDSKASNAEANCGVSIGSEIFDQKQIDQANFHEQIPPSIIASDIGNASQEQSGLLPILEIKDNTSVQVVEPVDFIEGRSPVPVAEESNVGCSLDHQCTLRQATCTTPQEGDDIEVETMAAVEDFDESQGRLFATCTTPQEGEVETMAAVEDFDEPQALEEDSKANNGEANCGVSIGSEICDQKPIDHANFHEQIPPSVVLEVHCSEFNDTTDKDQATAEPVETGRGEDGCPELNEVVEERAPETPTYIEGIHAFLHRRFISERRESGTESLDGSIGSEIEFNELLTIDHLKSALKAERKALGALYAELEEERSASAIAANQTMAMITRLQDEKAAMQMEALQYQRMMDEQSEYDQEALQLLNELMMKREREKQDLEKELEVYRKKVLLYEAKDMRKLKRAKDNGRSGTSSASSSAEESDDLSFELNEGDECFYSLNRSNQNTPIDAVLGSGTDEETAKHLVTLDESLADFEDERHFILEHLKVLEEKLFTMDDEDPSNYIQVIEHFSAENGSYESFGDDVNDLNVNVNGFSDDLLCNGKLHCETTNIGFKGKRLLPFFDAVSMENEDSLCTEQDAVRDVSLGSGSKFTMEHKKLVIAEEVDDLYERLQALEADREFLKHCINSLKKGDKGMHLLQEILQHLRDLRTVEPE